MFSDRLNMTTVAELTPVVPQAKTKIHVFTSDGKTKIADNENLTTKTMI